MVAMMVRTMTTRMMMAEKYGKVEGYICARPIIYLAMIFDVRLDC